MKDIYSSRTVTDSIKIYYIYYRSNNALAFNKWLDKWQEYNLVAMGRSACEQKELMKLFKCVLDTGIDVLYAFFTLKVFTLKIIGGSFTKLPDHEKHFLYHQWEQRKTMCCACLHFEYSIGLSTKMKNWIFQMLYDANGIEDPAHVIKRGGCW